VGGGVWGTEQSVSGSHNAVAGGEMPWNGSPTGFPELSRRA
jgi:hypothetical protein